MQYQEIVLLWLNAQLLITLLNLLISRKLDKIIDHIKDRRIYCLGIYVLMESFLEGCLLYIVKRNVLNSCKNIALISFS